MTRDEREEALRAATHEFCEAARQTAIMLNELTLVLENLRRLTDQLVADGRSD